MGAQADGSTDLDRLVHNFTLGCGCVVLAPTYRH